MKRVGVLGLLVLVTSCGPIVVGPSQISFQQLTLAPPVPLVARKSPRPAYLVLDPAKVPVEMPIFVNGVNQGGKLVDVRLFVERDLKRAFANYFDQVFVVGPAQAPTSGAAVIVDVRLDRLEVSSRTIEDDDSIEVRGTPTMTWSLALRPATASDYLWSFAGKSKGATSNQPQFFFRTLFEKMIVDLFRDYAQQHVQDRLLAVSN